MEDREQPEDVLQSEVVPGSPTLENVVFVLLGALSALAVVFRLVGII